MLPMDSFDKRLSYYRKKEFINKEVNRHIEKKLFDAPDFQKILGYLKDKKNVSITGVAGSAISFLAKYLFENNHRCLLILSSSTDSAEIIWNDLINILNENDVFSTV